MKRFLKWILYLLSIAVLAVAGGATYLKTAFPKEGPVLDVSINHHDSTLLARGKYLANAICGCVDCHSPRYFEYFGLPYKTDSIGRGGLQFTHELGFPGTFYSMNITPTGIGKWTDAQFYHAVTTGVTPEGLVLFPVMPYPHFSRADPEDIKAILAYVRTFKPSDATYPMHDVDFPVNLLYRMGPKPAEPVKRPPTSDTLAYGKYLLNLGACEDCHTPRNSHGDLVEDSALAGGNIFRIIGAGTVRAQNLSPDARTGMGGWTKDMFVNLFKSYNTPEAHKIPWKDKGYQTVMPWLAYCEMNKNDLEALFKYIQTLKPISHRVERWTPEARETAKL